jgi:UDP-2,4-diacetamido-2,4,6-trideoxy-beta-L-altropyranose hydrolase
MKIVVRADSAIIIGTGHIMRCLVLAQRLRDDGHLVEFACRAQHGDLIDFIKIKGFFVHKLTSPAAWQKPKHSADYSAWLQVTEMEDAVNFIENIKESDLVIIDHYGINKVWQQQVKAKLECRIVVIDDLVRTHDCDLLLDQTLSRVKDDYLLRVPASSKLLTGCDYALLNPNFAKIRQNNLTEISVAAPTRHRVLITMGGIDNTNVSMLILNELLTFIDSHKAHNTLSVIESVTVLVSTQSPYFSQVETFVSKHSNVFTLLGFVDDMAKLMLQHTIAIGAPGATSWERACLGLPSIIVPLAENQKMVCQQLTKSGVALLLNFDNITTKFQAQFSQLIKKYDSYIQKNLLLCDGLGLYRAAFAINQLFQTEISVFSGCRLATEKDIKQVYQWQKEPETRRFALNPDVPSFENHSIWMKRKLAAISDYFYIVEATDNAGHINAAGVVRLDKMVDESYLISIFISPAYYGLGLAKKALAYVDYVHSTFTINATVLPDNIPSHKLFKSAGYHKIKEDAYQRLAF